MSLSTDSNIIFSFEIVSISFCLSVIKYIGIYYLSHFLRKLDIYVLLNVGNISSYVYLIVPPSKPDIVSIVHTPTDTLLTSAKHTEYSTSSPSSTLTSEENETILEWQTMKQNNKTEYHRMKKDDYDTTTSTSSEVDF